MSVMSNVDPWFGTSMDDDGDNNLNSNSGNMDAELASIVSSLSALSNPTHKNNSNNGNHNNNPSGVSDRRGSTQLGGFRRPSLGYSAATATASPVGAHATTATNPSVAAAAAAAAGDQDLLMYSTMGAAGVPEDAASSQSSSPVIARRTALSVGTAPPYNSSYHQHRLHRDETTSLSGQHFFGNNNRMNFMGHYSASIAGPILFNHNDGDGSGGGGGGFFEKFGKSLIEGTKELESGSNGATDGSPVPQTNGHENSLVDNQNPLVSPVHGVRRTSVTSNSTASESVEQFADVDNKTRKNIWNVATAPIFKPDTNISDPFLIPPQQEQQQQQQQQQQQMSPNAPPFPAPFLPQFLPPTLSPPPIPPPSLSSAATPPPEASLLQNPYLYLGNDLYPGMPAPPPPQSLSQEPPANTGVMRSVVNPAPSSAAQGTRPPVGTTLGKRTVQSKNPTKKYQANPYLDSTNNPPTNTNGSRNIGALPNTFHTKTNSNGSNNNNNNDNSTTTNNNNSSTSNNVGNNNKRKNNGFNKLNSPMSTNSRLKNGSNGGKWSNYYTVRSPVLDEFRSNPTNKTYKIKDIVGYVLEFCQDQHGSRFIQYELASASASEREVIFNEIRDQAVELSDDVFGNYVIQKFFEFGSKTQRDILVSQFKGKMQELSMQMYACRVIQRALEFIELEQRIELVQELSTCVLEMIKDQNGNHVIQKAIESIPMTELPFILNSLDGQIYHLSTHAYGCRVIQRLLEFGSEDDQTRIFHEIKDFIPFLIQDQYGNYVIQHVLQQDGRNCLREMAETKQDIVNIVSQSVVEFSKHKFASNVVEKAILYGTNDQRRLIMSKVMPTDETSAANMEETAPMVLMMRDQFANYVVQKLVGVSEGRDKRLIVIAIKSYLEKLNKSDSVGNRNLASVEKLASLVESITI
ncbi:hypothetical protein ZYGR_0AG04480 [Zygosaccharomyces rouxii]|uniref:Pumilio homology domain family member 3 n=1 Tax=Zygosaccharomyces rouxii TaxID=4956 RepID=A0A1Q3A9S8_ZYGRO|nr:hypothetical protein ZYGR_0AG04480 [Zygosaccharomyces rouxii]